MAELHRVMNVPQDCKWIPSINDIELDDLRNRVQSGEWAMGGYLEKREKMYLAPQYQNKRNIHMGIDIWAPEGEPVFAPLRGIVAYTAFLNEEGNYGPVVVLKHSLEQKPVFVLYGHLSLRSLENLAGGQKLQAGDRIGWLGSETENGKWPPHLHLQLSLEDPGTADMPGVVSPDDLETAKTRYPDPAILIKDIGRFR